ncbi:hypothetical protein JHK85_002656 [Glycine max]|nr:hypothetical protein JHK85_002656 [Glycine max]
MAETRVGSVDPIRVRNRILYLESADREACRFKIMGNCMETYTIGEKQQQEEGEEERGGFVKNGLSMKVVLTKEELKWLILELKDKGGVRLEQMLEEIERGRREQKVEDEMGWKPSLESILEAPELLEMDTT